MKNTKKILGFTCIILTVFLFSCDLGQGQGQGQEQEQGLGLEGTMIDYTNTSGTISPEYAWVETCTIQDGTITYSKTGGDLVESLSFAETLTEEDYTTLKIKIRKIQSIDKDKKLVYASIGGGVTTLKIDNIITFQNGCLSLFSETIVDVNKFIRQLVEKYSS